MLGKSALLFRVLIAGLVVYLAGVVPLDAADITGTNGHDLLFFEGEETSVTATFINPYSGHVLHLDGTYNLNQVSYDGLAGIDTLFMTNAGDMLTLRNGDGEQMFFGIERILAGDGDDVLLLADATISLGDLLIDGGRGDDIIWANDDNDEIRGRDGNDIIHGGPGDDLIYGHLFFNTTTEDDNDILYGGDGNDTLVGGSGADQLYGDAGDDLLHFFADFVYQDGPFAGKNGSLDLFDGGTGDDTLEMTTGSDVLLAVNDDDQLMLFNIEQINAGAGDDVIDLTGYVPGSGGLIINGGEGNDAITGSTGDDHIEGGNGHDSLWGGNGNDTILGGSGNDTIYGGNGDDLIDVGHGADIAFGEAGDDTFLITGFNFLVNTLDGGDGADSLDVSQMLSGFDPLVDDVNLFVQVLDLGDDWLDIRLNFTGDVEGTFWSVAHITSIEWLIAADGAPAIEMALLIPEPASLMLLGVGLSLVLRRARG